jgi:DNA-methyltransferase (dcm)
MSNKLSKPTAISVFSGAGGMDIGVLNAGFDIKVCIEIDENCCNTLNVNIEKENRATIVIQDDIRNVSPNKLIDMTNLVKGDVDLLFGGSPCQAFSQIGKQKALEDERGLLLFEIIRFAREIQPKAIVVEQVKGLLNAKGGNGERGGVMKSFIKELESLDYVPKWKILKAAEYGIPQMRERLFIVATKKPNGFVFPEQTHIDPKQCNVLFDLKPYVTVGEALEGMGEPIVKSNLSIPPEDSHYDITPARDKVRINGVPEGKYLASQRHLPKEQLCSLSRKDTTKFLRVDRTKPSNTLRCGEIFFHPVEDRYLTPREYMRIHGFPDSYEFRGPIRGRCGTVRNLDQHRQVANSVPPHLAFLIAEQIRLVLNGKNI